jgi:chromosome segregation ATPase
LLEGLPQSWTWKQAQYAMRAVAYILHQGIDATRIREFLAFHHALEQGGITEEYFVDLVTALEDAGARGRRKRRILDRLIAQAALQVDVEDLQHQAHTLTAEITQLEAQRKALRTRVNEWRSRIETLSAQETAGHARVEGLAGEVAGYEQELTMLQATRLLLERQQGGAQASHAAVQQPQDKESGEQQRQAQPATTQHDRRWEQLLHALRQLGGQSKAAPQERNT